MAVVYGSMDALVPYDAVDGAMELKMQDRHAIKVWKMSGCVCFYHKVRLTKNKNKRFSSIWKHQDHHSYNLKRQYPKSSCSPKRTVLLDLLCRESSQWVDFQQLSQ